MSIITFDQTSLHSLCNLLAQQDEDLNLIIQTHGYPPFWSRPPSFQTLVHIILEQQVSLASAKAAFIKLQQKIIKITPENFLLLTDEELKSCYFSRQKITYVKALASDILSGEVCIEDFLTMDDASIKHVLQRIKGIGNWTTDVFLMMSLHRCDCFPAGDIALVKSAREVKMLPSTATREEVLLLAESWRPYRTIAAYLLWHAYIKKKNIVF